MFAETLSADRCDDRNVSAPPGAPAGGATPPPRRLPTRPARGAYPRCKAAVELVCAAALALVVLPVVVVCAALVKLTSRGPALYSQLRVGRNGRTFRIYKLRTMRDDCERHGGARWSTPGDPRVTPLGRFLRRTHLDELPQLWNVLKGDMSLVGPRPERPEFVPGLARVVPGYNDRHLVRPGVTGLAQVQLPPDTDLDSVRRKTACDLHYVQNVGLWLDLRLLLCTALHMLGVPYATLGRLFRLPRPADLPPAHVGDTPLPGTPVVTLPPK